MVWDQTFASNRLGWPDAPDSTAWLAPDGYHLATRQPGHFVAVEPAETLSLQAGQVSASFRKMGGPPGGGYGIIVHDQGPGPRDGLDQTGRYDVLEASHTGAVGVWRRENDHWVDLIPWQPTPAVHVGTEENELRIGANGPELLLVVNGVEVARYVDPTLASGSVGVFVGGDGNEALLSRLVVEALG